MVHAVGASARKAAERVAAKGRSSHQAPSISARPFCDSDVLELLERFEHAVYASSGDDVPVEPQSP